MYYPYLNLVGILQGSEVYIHIGVGFGVARSDCKGNARASKGGTGDRYRTRAFSFNGFNTFFKICLVGVMQGIRRNSMKNKKLSTLLIMATMVLQAHAQFGGSGSGTENAPYLITNEDELFDVRNNLSAHYKLIADLDLTEWIKDESPKDGWNPIGNSTTPFSGVFDGNYHTIKGLYINRPTMENIGLFGYLRDGTIKNTALINPNIIGKNYVGSIVGNILLIKEDHNDRYYCNNYVNNNVTLGGSVKGIDKVGGIIGGNNWNDKWYCYGYCSIIGNYASAYIEGNNNVGGIIGLAQCRNYYYDAGYTYYTVYNFITNNSFHGYLTATGESVGGIVGNITLGTYRSNTTSTYSLDNNIAGGNIFGKKILMEL
ncbi:MAG: hypothetical protein IKI26_04665 [Prevotella sp.]|nr:hypothetical protein [Prevotella sp.]